MFFQKNMLRALLASLFLYTPTLLAASSGCDSGTCSPDSDTFTQCVKNPRTGVGIPLSDSSLARFVIHCKSLSGSSQEEPVTCVQISGIELHCKNSNNEQPLYDFQSMPVAEACMLFYPRKTDGSSKTTYKVCN